MAVATPVLERNTDTEERELTREYRDTYMSDEEKHNLLIGANYAKLINPESKPRDIIPESKPAQKFKGIDFAPVKVENAAPVQEQQVVAPKPYLVENARADADIFRADSPVNRKVVEPVQVQTAVVISQVEEDENEDLRPTQTTIQYKTAGVKKTADEGKIETKPAQVLSKHFALTKKDKIIIAVALTVIVALFVLIIVNSVVISNLSSDVGSLQTTLFETESTYNQVIAEKTEFLENVEQIIGEWAPENGMIR